MVAKVTIFFYSRILFRKRPILGAKIAVLPHVLSQICPKFDPQLFQNLPKVYMDISRGNPTAQS